MGLRVSLASKLKPIGGGEGKPSLNRATKSILVDPKPGDLSMTRVKGR
jgi:hypothetical protein